MSKLDDAASCLKTSRDFPGSGAEINNLQRALDHVIQYLRALDSAPSPTGSEPGGASPSEAAPSRASCPQCGAESERRCVGAPGHACFFDLLKEYLDAKEAS